MPKKKRTKYSKTSEDLHKQRVSSAKKRAQSRAKRTLHQKEQDRSTHSQQVALQRASRTPQQLEESRSYDTKRKSMKRSFQTIDEANHERALALGRMKKRRLMITPDEQQHQQQTNTAYQQQKRSEPWKDQLNSAFQYDPEIEYESHKCVSIGTMTKVCRHCKALKWPDESQGMCCSDGKVVIPHLEEPPEPLKSLLDQPSFVKDARKYNSCFQMTSFGATKIITEPGFMPTVKIQGQVYHSIGSLLPPENEEPKFLQIYFMGDASTESLRRCSVIPNTKQRTVFELQEMLHEVNPYVKSFKSAIDKKLPHETTKIVIRGDKTPAGEHDRRWNAPQVDEVAVLMTNESAGKRDIVLEWRSGKLKRIDELHRSYDPLQYPLIFWDGEDGFVIDNPMQNTKKPKRISAKQFYSYRIMVRENSSNHLLKCGPLFSQYLVDMYAKVESNNLSFIRHNQSKLRAEEYIHLRDAVSMDKNPKDLGKVVILPSSHIGSPRHMHEYTQDAMTYVRNYGKPDLFITFTCNPTWPEIKAALFPGQEPTDRHDIIARVFHLKVKKLEKLVTEGHIFGEDRCHMYTVEWQKRGLPHIHMLLWLKEKIQPGQVDSIISAEIPDPEKDPKLHAIVVKNMVHGPCGKVNPNSPCMQNGQCSKDFPKDFQKETQTNENGYPLYKRKSPEDGGFKATVHHKGNALEIDNRYIVPYCPLLLRTFNAHINVEFCSSVKSIKYICKYINKGSDMAIYQVTKDGEAAAPNKPAVDEIDNYQLGKYLCSSQAVNNLLGFGIHDRAPAVYHLQVHLENGQRVYFTEENLRERVEAPRKTSLLSFFDLCKADDFAKTLLYADVPKYYTLEQSKQFRRRKRGVPVEGHPAIFESDTLGRVYTVHPSNMECFCLRILLHTVPGPTSFEDLRTFEGQVYPTFQAACQVRGLLEDDKHFDSALEEASLCHVPSRLRDLFVIMLATCTLGNPQQLWDKHKESMSDDILMQVKRLNPQIAVTFTAEVFNKALIIIEDKLDMMCGKKLTDLGMESPKREAGNKIHSEMLRETSYNIESLHAFVEEHESTLVEDQRAALDCILQLHQDGQGGIVFLDSPGGTGKTFLINLLLAKVRKNKDIAMAVASSGIAATLLSGGRTAHSALKLPLDLAREENPTCSISKDSGLAQVLRQCKLIVWDECTMSHKRAFEAVDKTLQDIRENKAPFGGLLVVMSGDFRQTLPVIPRGTPADEIYACVKHSHLWQHVVKLQLSTNMRVHLFGDQDAGSFANVLLRIGNGEIPINPVDGQIDIPKDCCTLASNLTDLITHVYPNISEKYQSREWLCERAILAPKNDMVNFINQKILKDIPDEEKIYRSVDKTMSEDEAIQFPTEFLNSLLPSGMPPHVLALKKGAPVILLRNLDPPRLCNGTRLQVKQLLPHVIEATILTGQYAGEHVFVPRIPLISSELGFDFKRIQFPLKLCFAMSINKAQGQSLKVTGLHLDSPCFSHGQLYVGCSRVGSSKRLFVFAPNGKTVNVVYPQVLQ